jgi:hypothetical protein
VNETEIWREVRTHGEAIRTLRRDVDDHGQKHRDLEEAEKDRKAEVRRYVLTLSSGMAIGLFTYALSLARGLIGR